MSKREKDKRHTPEQSIVKLRGTGILFPPPHFPVVMIPTHECGCGRQWRG